jgi:hypothetical protein
MGESFRATNSFFGLRSLRDKVPGKHRSDRREIVGAMRRQNSKGTLSVNSGTCRGKIFAMLRPRLAVYEPAAACRLPL